MRFPYLGVARVKYLLSMHEHRRWVDRSFATSALADVLGTQGAAGLFVGPQAPPAKDASASQTPPPSTLSPRAAGAAPRR